MFQSIICDFRKVEVSKKRLKKLAVLVDEKLDASGTVWIFSEVQKKTNSISPVFFEICNFFSYLYLKNIILKYCPEKNKTSFFFNDHVEHILFFSKSKKFFLNKDPIREKHIWKDVEWGKRKKNYNPKGKDPGNVWIRTEDDGKANITKHIPLGDSEALERVILCSSNKKDKILLINFKKTKNSLRKISYEEI